MQDEVESKTLTLIVSGTKFTGRLFKAAMMKYLAHLKEVRKARLRSPFQPIGESWVRVSKIIMWRVSSTNRSKSM